MGIRSVQAFLALTLVLALPAAVSAQARVLVDVRDERDQPLYNVRITVVHERSGEPAGECRTDFAGRCVITLAPLRPYIARAAAPANYQPSPPVQLFPAAGDTRVGFGMWPPPPPPPERDDSGIIVPGFIVGAVRSLMDEPIVGVAVHALSGGLYNGAQDTTREDGSFRIRVIPGTYTIRAPATMARKSGYVFGAAAYGAPVTVTAGQETGPVILYPASFKLPSVNITVVTPAGIPAAGADVISFSDSRSFNGSTFSANNAGKAGKDGTVVLTSVFPGKLVLTATATVGDKQLAGMEIVEVGDAPLDVYMRLGAAAQVSGRVEFSGLDRPLHGSGGIHVMAVLGPNYAYSLVDPNGLVGPEGEFTLKGLAGERCLGLRSLPYGWRLAEITQYGRLLEHNRLSFLEGQRVTGIVLHVVPDRSDMPRATPPCPLTNR